MTLRTWLAPTLLSGLLNAGMSPHAVALGTQDEAARWQRESQAVTIVRDTWGIAHIYGRADADVVFGTAYAQAEDDFGRIERNYLTALGCLAEADGEAAIYSDLRQRLFMQPAQLKQLYATSPAWLRELMTAWADGLNFYLQRHPNVHAKVRNWNRRTSADSTATSVAIFWGNTLIDMKGAAARAAEQPVYDFLVANLSDAERLSALATAVDTLQRTFGQWQTPWGDINRFQRLTDDVVQPFDDSKPSLPVGFAPAQWGALASFDSQKPRSTRKIYGSSGNSFIAAVEFGAPVRAKALMSGGASGDPASPHFTDQATRFSQGQFRDVLFTPDDVSAHAERRYHPGECCSAN